MKLPPNQTILFSIASLVLLLSNCSLWGQVRIWTQVPSPRGAVVSAFTETESGLYAAYNGLGLHRLNEKTDEFDPVAEQEVSLIMDMGSSADGTTYLSNWTSVYELDEEGGRLVDTKAPRIGGYRSIGFHGGTLYAGSNHGLYRLGEGGWERIPLLGDERIWVNIHAIASAGDLIVAGSDRRVFYSTDGGQNWQPSENFTQFGIVSLTAAGPGVVIAGTSGDGIFDLTTKGEGLNVLPQRGTDGDGEGIVSALYLDAKDGKLLRGSVTKGVLSETGLFGGILADPEIRSITKYRGDYYCGTYESGVFRLLGLPLVGGLAGDRTIDNRPTPRGISLSPNPATDEIMVSWKLGDHPPSGISCSIVSATGAEVFRRDLSNPADERTAVDVSRFASGLYHCVITTSDGERLSNSFIVQR